MTSDPSLVRLGVVIPTLQLRPDYLAQALDSALASELQQIVVVSPNRARSELVPFESQVTWLIQDLNLPDSINAGVFALRPDITHFLWIGDDDLLEPAGLEFFKKSNYDSPLTIGKCRLIDGDGGALGILVPRKRRLQPFVMTLRANPISQPSAIFSRTAFIQVGGVSNELPLAFDFDLFFKFILAFGTPAIINHVTASYRIHETTLSQTKWLEQLREASTIRKTYSPLIMRPLVSALEFARESGLRIVMLLKK